MSYVNKMVSVYGTEKEFIQGFVNELTAADSRITCETDIDAEFANGSTSYKPTIILAVGEVCKINLIRYNVLNSNSSSYSINLTIKENTYILSTNMAFSNSTSGINNILTRSWRLKLISNDNVIQIFLGAYTDTANTYKINIAVVIDTINCVAYSSTVNTLASSFITLEETSRTLSLSNRIPYSLDDQQVEIITNKTLVDSASSKVLNTQALYDCSTVVKDSVAIIDSQRFYAIDEHTLMLIKE